MLPRLLRGSGCERLGGVFSQPIEVVVSVKTLSVPLQQCKILARLWVRALIWVPLQVQPLEDSAVLVPSKVLHLAQMVQQLSTLPPISANGGLASASAPTRCRYSKQLTSRHTRAGRRTERARSGPVPVNLEDLEVLPHDVTATDVQS
eukprot:4437138-Prymnesium_polylepis.1